MKIFSIFKKNLKTVSRNLGYFIVLFICPVILISISGIMLTSSSFDNVKIGVINENPNYEWETNLKNTRSFNSLEDCLLAISNGHVSICVHISQLGNKDTFFEVYLDNSKRSFGEVAKRFFMESLMNEQTSALQKTSEEINSKLTVYSNSMIQTKNELVSIEQDLDEQEVLLMSYQNNLSYIIRNFDEVYNEVLEIQAIATDLERKSYQLTSNIESTARKIKSNKDNINTNINSIRLFLSARLTPQDYSQVSSNLDSITYSLNEIDLSLLAIQAEDVNKEISTISSNLSRMVEIMKNTRQILIDINSDLTDNIEKTRENKQRIKTFSEELDKALLDIDSVSQSLEKENVVLSFKNAFAIQESPFFLAFPLLIAIIITFTATVLPNMFILKQVNQPSYLRNLITPTRDTSFLIADYLINLFIISIQIGVLFLIGIFWFNVPSNTMYSFLIVTALAASIFIFLGMSFGYLIKSQNLSMLVTVFFTISFFVFSDLIVSTVTTPPVVNFFIELNPFAILYKLLSDTILIGKTLDFSSIIFLRLMLFLCSSFFICYISRKISKENTRHKWILAILIILILIGTYQLLI